MSFDEEINRVLKEAYFNSPYEKATGIKRQIAEMDLSMGALKDIEKSFARDPESSEFRQSSDRVKGVIERTAVDLAEVFQMSIKNGFTEGRKDRDVAKRLANLAFKMANEDIPDDTVVTPDPDSERGLRVDKEGTVDAWSLPQFGALLTRVGELTIGKTPMSQERVRNIILTSINEVKKLLGMGLYDKTDKEGHGLEPFEDPNSDMYTGG